MQENQETRFTSVFESSPYIQKMFLRGGLSQGVRGFRTGSPWYDLKYTGIRTRCGTYHVIR